MAFRKALPPFLSLPRLSNGDYSVDLLYRAVVKAYVNFPISMTKCTNVPDLTLPLVEMAEMDSPVMVVTVTDISMISQVNAMEKST